MPFRNPLTTATGSASVDTGAGPGRVVIADSGGRYGGGAIMLHPDNDQDGPGYIEAGALSDGASVISISASPVSPGGNRPTLELRSFPNTGPGSEMSLRGPGDIYLDPWGTDVAAGRTRAVGLETVIDGQWKPAITYRGTVLGTTDASGLLNIAHGMGFAPSHAMFAPVFRNDTINSIFLPTLGAITSTHLQLVAFRMDTHARLGGAIVRVAWAAWP